MSRAPLFISARIRRRSATIRLTVEASRKHQLTVRALLLPVKGVCQSGNKKTSAKQDSCRTSAASSKSELVMPMVGLDQLTRYETISAGHCTCQTKFAPVPLRSIQAPPHARARGVTETQRNGKVPYYFCQAVWMGKLVITELLPMRDLLTKGIG